MSNAERKSVELYICICMYIHTHIHYTYIGMGIDHNAKLLLSAHILCTKVLGRLLACQTPRGRADIVLQKYKYWHLRSSRKLAVPIRQACDEGTDTAIVQTYKY